MTGMPEHAHRAAERRQPRDRRVDHDPATGVNAGPPSDRDGAGDAPDEAVRHDPALYSTGRHGCWADCTCGWKSGLYTTTTGAHRAFGEHLTASHPHTPADPHPHAWADLGTPGLHGSVCRLCGETQID